MTKYPALRDFFSAYTTAGYDPAVFDLLVTAAPSASDVLAGKSLAGYRSSAKTLTPEQQDDLLFLWGYANRLRDRNLLPPAISCKGEDFQMVVSLASSLCAKDKLDTADSSVASPVDAFACAPVGRFGDYFRKSTLVAKAKLQANAEAAAAKLAEEERQRATEIPKHTAQAKRRIVNELLKLNADMLTAGVVMLSFGSTTHEPCTDDCVVSRVSRHEFGTVYSVPNHFIHQETRRALQTWLEAEGFRTVEITPGSPDTTGIQADILLEWDV